jgi:hypothetical protein
MKINKAHNWKLIFFLLIVCLWIISIIINLAQNIYNHTGLFGLGLPSPMIQYSFAEQGLTIDHPDSWRIMLTPQGSHGDEAMFALIGIPLHSIPYITMAKSTSYGDILSVAQWGEMRAKSSSEYQSVSLSAYDAKYFPAMLREYTYTEETPFAITEIRCLDYYILYTRTGYAFSFCAEQKNWSEVLGTFTEMIRSIKPKE